MPYQEKKKERRRRDVKRMKDKSLTVAHIQNRMMYWNESEHCNDACARMISRAIKQAEYMAVCSCDQCGNPRRNGDITLQEMRENDKFNSYFE